MLKQNDLLKPSMIALPTLHLTLLVVHLADKEQVNRYAHLTLSEMKKIPHHDNQDICVVQEYFAPNLLS